MSGSVSTLQLTKDLNLPGNDTTRWLCGDADFVTVVRNLRGFMNLDLEASVVVVGDAGPWSTWLLLWYLAPMWQWVNG